jgi:hypothetical protein
MDDAEAAPRGRAGRRFAVAVSAFFTQISFGGSDFRDLCPGFLLIDVGLGFSFLPIAIAAPGSCGGREPVQLTA